MKNQLKNLKAAAKQPVFIHFWMGGSIKSLESQFFRKFQIFSFFFIIFFQKKLKKMKFVKIREKQRKKFENSSKTASFPPLFVPGNCQK